MFHARDLSDQLVVWESVNLGHLHILPHYRDAWVSMILTHQSDLTGRDSGDGTHARCS